MNIDAVLEMFVWFIGVQLQIKLLLPHRFDVLQELIFSIRKVFRVRCVATQAAAINVIDGDIEDFHTGFLEDVLYVGKAVVFEMFVTNGVIGIHL